MAIKSVSQEADDILLASSMISLGARLQVLEAETSLSHDRLARLYREIRGCSPPKGMLPFSVDWFMTWLPNIHSSLFYNVYSFLNARTTSRASARSSTPTGCTWKTRAWTTPSPASQC